MAKYAVVETGGKQYRVEEGEPLITERLPEHDSGDEVVFDRVLFVRDGDEAKIGQPYVDGAQVVGTVDEEFKGDKITVFKYKRKKRQRRKTGHRQRYTRTTIDKIEA